MCLAIKETCKFFPNILDDNHLNMPPKPLLLDVMEGMLTLSPFLLLKDEGSSFSFISQVNGIEANCGRSTLGQGLGAIFPSTAKISFVSGNFPVFSGTTWTTYSHLLAEKTQCLLICLS